MNKAIIVVISILILIVVVYRVILVQMNTVQLVKVSEKELERKLGEDKYWMLLSENNKKELENYNINIDIVDFSKYNIIISFAREIKAMKYKKTFPFEKDNRVITTVSKDVIPNKLFIYKIDKNKNVYLDEKSLNLDKQILIEN